VSDLPTFDACRHRLSVAEAGDGWLVECDEAGLYLVICRELVTALADVLRSSDASPVLEVCAGSGALAAALCDAGVPVRATDEHPTGDFPVDPIAAEEALRRNRPRVVLAAFVPIDSGVDRLVMKCPTVRQYVLLGARVGGQFGSDALWSDASWKSTLLTDVTRWMITRHDVALFSGCSATKIMQHGETWQFSRS
jgi:hypothetical protein